MAQEPLVESDIAAGRELLRAFRQSGFPIVGAYWLYLTEDAKWKLMVVTDQPLRRTRELYLSALSLEPELDLSKVQFVTPNDPVFKAIQTRANPSRSGDSRLSQSMVNGVYVDEAFIYRSAA